MFLWTIFDFQLSSTASYYTTIAIISFLPLGFILIFTSIVACLNLAGPTAWNGARSFLYEVSEWFHVTGNLIFIGYYSSIFRLLSCNYIQSHKEPFLDSYPSEHCWVGEHRFFSLIAMYSLVLWLPLLLGYILDPLTVGGMSPDPERKHLPDFSRNIWTLPSFLLQDAIVKIIGIGLAIAFSKYPWAVSLFPGFTTLVLLFMVALQRPCFHWLFNVWRFSFLLAALWSSICSLVAWLVSGSSLRTWLPFNLLGLGWLVILCATLLFIHKMV